VKSLHSFHNARNNVVVVVVCRWLSNKRARSEVAFDLLQGSQFRYGRSRFGIDDVVGRFLLRITIRFVDGGGAGGGNNGIVGREQQQDAGRFDAA